MAGGEDNILSDSCRNYNADEFPAGLRVLVVDDDPCYLSVLEKMLRDCLYQVTTCDRAKDALFILEEDKNKFDLVISDLHMPEMDGFQLLEMMELLDIDVPVVVMSVDDQKEVVMKCILKGACEYLAKPLQMETIKFIWRHVFRRKQKCIKESEKSTESAVNGGDNSQLKQSSAADSISIQNEENNAAAAADNKILKRRKTDEDDSEIYDDVTTAKKPRIIWTVELHQKFVRAVNQLGRDKAVPKKILECMKEMNVTGLTRENVASHLQKYRLYLQRQTDSLPETGNLQPYMDLKRSIFQHQQSPVTDVTSGGQFAVPGLNIPEAGGFEKIPANSRVGIPFVDQRNLFRIPDSSFYPFTDFSNPGAVVAYNNLSSPNEEHEYTYLGNTHDQHSRNLSTGDPYELKSEYMYDQFMPEPLLYVKYFDQEDHFRGPFL
ncbi:hypothetical protein LWI28_025647 [Acer negundo]|uniref:Two-component response regulator n=1 Tax=Acer negundo TaxID=4023 RepID=A0AAD5J2J8_ACENE|nr:hypothetical protein LWI28_025647 [Acer negundo]